MEKYYEEFWNNGNAYKIIDENGKLIRYSRNAEDIEGLTKVMNKGNPAIALHENNVHAAGEFYIPGPFIKDRSVTESVCNSVKGRR